jgi:hypothetical protein
MSVVVVAVTLVCLTGCIRRTISITSEPAGALVHLNDREIGRTPVQVDFLYYGDYDVRLTMDGYEPLMTRGAAKAPWWDSIPLDLATEMIPGQPHSRIEWHYVLEPRRDDPAALLKAARELRELAAREGKRGLTPFPHSD